MEIDQLDEDYLFAAEAQKSKMKEIWENDYDSIWD
jgi:hypothetical protein